MSLPEGVFVRFTCVVDGEVVDEVDLGPEAAENPVLVGEMAERHAEFCTAGQQDGHTYMIQVVFFDGEVVRWGTDVDGMDVPVEVGVQDLALVLDKYFNIGVRCDATRIGYICQRGVLHEPSDLHGQFLAQVDEDYIRVALWQDEGDGVTIKKLNATEARRTLTG